MQNRRNQNVEREGIVWIKFYGPNLEAKSIPIFELGQTLVAFQAILHKAFLFKQGRLTKGAVVSREERGKLALQIVKKESGSDEYGLMRFFADPAVIDHLKIVLVDALLALLVFAVGGVIKRRKRKQEESNNEPLVRSIYNQVNVIVDRIDNIGGIEHIEISAPDEWNVPTIRIDRSTQEYVRQLQYEPVFGEIEEIEGIVHRLYTTRDVAVIRRSPGDYVHVWLNREDFETVRYQTDNETLITFGGRPMYFLGKETSKFEDYKADRIVGMRKTEE